MEIGLLWFDSGERTVEVKVAEVAGAYKRRFGVVPNVCYVNPADVGEERVVKCADGTQVKVRPAKWILRFHLWAGVERVAPAGVDPPALVSEVVKPTQQFQYSMEFEVVK